MTLNCRIFNLLRTYIIWLQTQACTMVFEKKKEKIQFPLELRNLRNYLSPGVREWTIYGNLAMGKELELISEISSTIGHPIYVQRRLFVDNFRWHTKYLRTSCSRLITYLAGNTWMLKQSRELIGKLIEKQIFLF